MNAKTCKRMRRYIKSLGYDSRRETMYLAAPSEAPITLRHKALNPRTLTVHPQIFRAQYQKLKKMVKQNKINAPIGVRNTIWP